MVWVPVVRTALKWVVPALVAGAVFKTKGPGEAGVYDPDHPDSVGGAPPPTGGKQVQDIAYGCETVSGKFCDSEDVRDWVATYEQQIQELAATNRRLADVANREGWSGSAAQLVNDANAIINGFNAKYAGYETKVWQEGSEYGEIIKINEQIAAVIRIRKSLLTEIARLDPDELPEGLSPTEVEHINREKDKVPAGAYAAGGAILGLGLALAVIVAANSKKKPRPAY